jgi:NADH-quinone oxidoreductase subunit G
MPRLIIDDIAVDVPEGTNLLEAARSIGITIPHFCWHPALGRAGACRACAVKMLDGPVKGLQMSCMLTAQDGMVVSTSDEEAVAMRRAVIEWLMINHPHDCPVCDEGGECQLQDYTIAGGHGIRRYDGKKRNHTNQYLGEQIEHEMNRCIQCYRCVRFYQDYAGGSDFGVTGRAGSVYFGRQQDGNLESPFSGNLVDICPTGVFTDKTARFRARYWDYDMAPSICPHCSLGCNTIPMARYRELLKVTARRNDVVNGWFICDRGRFSNTTVNAPERPRHAQVDGLRTSMDATLDVLAERLKAFCSLGGTSGLAIIGSSRMSLEGNIMAAYLREMTGAGTLCYFSGKTRAECSLEAVSLLTDENCASLEDIRQANMVVILECDLLKEAPMMALAVRQTFLNGAKVYLVGSEALANDAYQDLFISELIPSLSDAPLTSATRPVIISGACRNGLDQIRSTSGVKLAFILDDANTFGCTLLAHEHDAVSLSEALSGGLITAVIVLEADLSDDLPPEVRVLAVADWRQNRLWERAETCLPVTSWIEMDGCFINNEGRAQRFRKVMNPGLPVKGLDPDGHPPRLHRHDAPGSDILPTDRLLSILMQRMGGTPPDDPLSGTWERLRELDADSTGIYFLLN